MGVTCRACGQVNAEKAQFCANPDCGAYLEWEGERPAGGPYAGRARVPGGVPPPGDAMPPREAMPPGMAVPPAGATPSPDSGDQRIGVRATLADPVTAVTPGSPGSTTLSVYNAGTRVEGFTITVSGPAAVWTVVEPPELSVYPEQTGAVTLRFAPPRASSCPAGHAWYVVRLDSTVHRGLVVTANGAAAVAAYHEVTAELVPPTGSGRGTTKHQVMVDNRGNVVERAQLSAADDEGAFRMQLGRTVAELPPGRTGIPLTVRAPWRWFGGTRTVPIHAAVAVEGMAAPLRADGTRHVVPVFPRWAPAAALVTALLLGGGGAVFALAGGDEKPSTTPTSISTNPPPSQPSPTTPATGGPSVSPVRSSPASSPASVPPPADPLDKIVPADCLSYDPNKLKIYDAGAIGWRLVETLASGQEHWMLILDNQADATAALAVARRSTSSCFIGRGNTRPNRADYIVDYWKGKSGQATTIPAPDCIPYNKAGLKILDEGATGWLLTDGSSRMLILDNQQDAKNALTLAQANSKQCFIGRSNARPNRRDYIVQYWLA